MLNSNEETRNLVRLDDHVVEFASKVKSISVGESCGDVRILPTDDQEIAICYYGTADILSSSVGFNLSCQKGLLDISLTNTGKIRKNRLSLDIYVPKDKILEKCIIRSSNNISIKDGIKADYVSSVSTYGSIQINSQFESAYLSAPKGIVVNTRAERNIYLEVTSAYGDINLHLDNVANILYHNLDGTSLHRHLKDNFKPTIGGFVAQLEYNVGVNTITVE